MNIISSLIILFIQPSTKNNLYNQVLRIIKIAVKSDVKTGRI